MHFLKNTFRKKEVQSHFVGSTMAEQVDQKKENVSIKYRGWETLFKHVKFGPLHYNIAIFTKWLKMASCFCVGFGASVLLSPCQQHC